MTITAVIATFNRRNYLRILLDQLQKQALPANVLLKIIVVVDGSTDGTLEMLREEYAEVEVIEGSGNWWWTKCMNEGFKLSHYNGSDFALVLNDDNEITENYISQLIVDYSTLPKGSILGSASCCIEPANTVEFGGTYNLKAWRMKYTPYFSGFTPVDTNFKGIHNTYSLNGRGTFIPMDVFTKIGYYNQKLVQYGSDDDFVLRAKKKGIPVYISWNARIFNHAMLTSQGSAFKQESLKNFFGSFFNPYSVNSIKKTAYFYAHHGVTLLTPLYLLYFVAGTTYAYLFKYRNP